MGVSERRGGLLIRNPACIFTEEAAAEWEGQEVVEW